MTDPIATLRPLFVERCRDDLRDIRRLRERSDMDGLCAIVHRLAGAAGSFGFPDISRAALIVDQHIRYDHQIPEADMERLLALLVELSTATASPPVKGPSTGIG